MRKAVILAAICLCFLTGCGNAEPEKRDYPLTLAMDLDESGEDYLIIYGLPNMPASTGQEKKEENNKNNGIFRGASMDETEKKYMLTKEKRLDLGHVEALILGERLWGSSHFEEALKECRDRIQLREDICLFVTKDVEEAMKCNGQEVDSLGEYLSGLYENRVYPTVLPKVTLRDVYNRLGDDFIKIRNRIPNIDNTLHIIRGEVI